MGKKWSEIQNERVDSYIEKNNTSIYGFFLDIERQELYHKINLRCKKMIEDGFLDEAKKVSEKYGTESPAFKSLGFNFALDYLNGKKNMEVFLEEFSQSHRNYAKRQITWFRKEPLLKKLDWNSALTEIKNIEKRLQDVS
jgi:tRNA dimethylallyltransferase